MVWYQLLIGPVDQDGLRHVRDLLAKEPIAFDDKLVTAAAELFHEAEGEMQSSSGTLVAAIAIEHGGKLVTGNAAAFRCFEAHGLKVISL